MEVAPGIEVTQGRGFTHLLTLMLVSDIPPHNQCECLFQTETDETESVPETMSKLLRLPLMTIGKAHFPVVP